jgi:glutathione S-transferase
MTLKLYIGNPNYSSWSMRAGVLLRAFGIAHDEILIRIDGFDANSTFKTEVNRIGATGTVPFLIDTSVQDGHDQSLIITDTLSIVEYIAETFADHAIWPKDRAMRAKARNLCAEMHSGFGALRQHCMMNIGPDLSRAGALIWRDHAAVRRDVARIETAWADMLALSGGP